MNNNNLSKILFSVLVIAIIFITIQFMTASSSSIDENMNISGDYENTYEVEKDITLIGMDVLTVVVFVLSIFIMIYAFKRLK